MELERSIEAALEQRTPSPTPWSRATKALHSANKGVGVISADNFLAGMQRRAQAAQHRIREAVAGKNRRDAGWLPGNAPKAL